MNVIIHNLLLILYYDINNSLSVFMLIVTFCISSITAMASENNSIGTLISIDHINNSDGTSTIEKVYTNHPISFYADKMYGTDTFTKVKEDYTGLNGNGTLLVSYQVTGTFDWDTEKKTAKIYNVSGVANVAKGQGEAINKKTSTSGNNTTKATGKFTFTYSWNSGKSTKNYSISISCNYKGTNS